MSGWKHRGRSLIQKGKIMEPLTAGGEVQDPLWLVARTVASTGLQTCYRFFPCIHTYDEV